MTLLLTLIVGISVIPCYAFSDKGYCDNICQQCNTRCSIEQNATGQAVRHQTEAVGPAGQKGEAGNIGHPGFQGIDGRKGPRGSPGSPDMEAIGKLMDKKIHEALYGGSLPEGSPYRSCRDARIHHAGGTGVANGAVNISIPALGETEVICDFTTDGGDWIVFQRRMDGSIDFYRDWNEYVNGFGQKDGEFWLGLEAMHQLTSHGKWEMRTELVTIRNERFFVKYSHFRLGSSLQNYTLNVSGFFGNTTNAIGKEHGGQPFTTRDVDHDNNSDRNCAVEWHGAWWYKNCGNLHSNLNGQYGDRGFEGLSWFRPSLGWTIMRFSEMKMRPKFRD